MTRLSRIGMALFAATAALFPALCDETHAYRAGTRRETWQSEPSAWGQEQWKIGLAGNAVAAGNLERGNAFGFGGQLIYRFFDVYSLCLAVDNYRAKEKTRGDGAPENASRDDFNVVAGSLSFRVHLTIADAFPSFYGGGGAGAYSFDAPDDSTRWLFHSVFGIEYAVLHPFGFFAEYRYTFHNLSFDDPDDHGLFRLGVNYAF